MSYIQFQEVLHQRFENIKEIRTGIIRAEDIHNSHLVGIYYFDYSNKLLESDFDLLTYQDELISEEYYTHPGSLQWNYYLFFVCPEGVYSELQRTGLASIIETDRVYARKYVTTEDALRSQIRRKVDFNKHENNEVPKDIAVRWIEKLKERHLDGVFMPDIPMTEVVKQYIAGNPVLEPLEDIVEQAQDIHLPLSFLEQMVLEKYRPYPTQSEFTFKTANLIEGVNGSGKTSLFEAIELWVCGKTSRNPKLEDQNTRIGIKVLGRNAIEKNTSNHNGIYRQRDRFWYGNLYPRGNRLFQSFNRFNYYDTDAASKLIFESKKSNDFKDALCTLIAGENVNIIEKRLESLQKTFREQQKKHQKEIEC